MDLGDILTPDVIKADLQATNRWEAIDELINTLVASDKIKSDHREAIVAVVKKRETSMGQFQKHLHTLAKIAKLLHKKEFRQALEVAPDAQAMYQIIKAESGK